MRIVFKKKISLTRGCPSTVWWLCGRGWGRVIDHILFAQYRFGRSVFSGHVYERFSANTYLYLYRRSYNIIYTAAVADLQLKSYIIIVSCNIPTTYKHTTVCIVLLWVLYNIVYYIHVYLAHAIGHMTFLRGGQDLGRTPILHHPLLCCCEFHIIIIIII